MVCDAIIWLERAINWNGWHLLNGHSENIVANIDDQIVLFTFYALNSRQFCELTVQHRKCMESHMHTHAVRMIVVVAGCCRLRSPFLFCIYGKCLRLEFLCSIQCQWVVDGQWTKRQRWQRQQWHVWDFATLTLTFCSFFWWLAKTKQRLIIFLMA